MNVLDKEKVDIQKLLRLKRYQAPPSGFYENFLIEFRRRQRVDLLRRTLRPSLRRTLADRLSPFLTSLQMSSLAFASIGVVGILVALAIWVHFSGPRYSHDISFDNFLLAPPLEIPRQHAVGTFNLENRPASYEAPLSF